MNHARSFTSQLRNQSSAFTLLEVIFALAILAGSLAVLGEVMSIANRHAEETQAETKAQLLATSIMNELAAGLTQLAEQSRQPLDVEDTVPWICSVALGNTDMAGLTAVEVIVEQDLDAKLGPAKFRLVRWLPNTTEAEDESEQSAGEEQDSA